MNTFLKTGSRLGLGLGAALVLAACGAGLPTTSLPAGAAPAPSAPSAAAAPPAAAGAPDAGTADAGPLGPLGTLGPLGSPTSTVPRDLPTNAAEASRFVTKSTFGSTQADIDRVMQLGYSGWIDEQFTTPSRTHLANIAERSATLGETGQIGSTWMQNSFWRNALTGEDVLRQRVSFALSQIFVVSQMNSAIDVRMAAGYYDILGRNAFGNFRTLLEEVSLSPAMGIYLSHLGNRKTDLLTGRLPDENYAREIMQLFTIGLYQLNQDGTVKVDPSDGQPIETYGVADIQGLAKVFTGFSWGGPDTSSARFVNNRVGSSERDILPMQGYPQYHEDGPKSFLGRTINTSTPNDSLKQALDILFNHENVGPFIGRLLIQRMVTSNPSPGYVGRVAAAFANNGQGVRGDMKAVIRAVLLDPEAANPPAAWASVNGRIREPVLRMTALLRALGATSTSKDFRIDITDNPANSLGQSPMRAPSVFNFYRPGYVPPNSELSRTRLGAADRVPVAPELQITNEVSVAGWLIAAKAVIDNGIGSGTDVKPAFTPLVALAHNPSALVDRLILLLAPANQIPQSLRNEIVAEVSAITLPTTGDAAARLNRVKLATLLLVVSPEFMLQR
ncbi:MAG: DUF1800 domain-containing protein [Burkholderiales bacterium]|nr:DUF1800 domain-containing protein [Burkholderiales bacterium]